MTLGELIRKTERRLGAARLHYGHGTDNPHDEAAWLVLRGGIRLERFWVDWTTDYLHAHGRADR